MTVYRWVATFEHGPDLEILATHWKAALENALDELHNSPDHENLISLTAMD